MNRVRTWIVCVGNLGLILGFVAALWLPYIGKKLRLDTQEMSDNRTPAAWPELKFNGKTLETAPGQIDAYYNDHFGFRNDLIRWHSYVQVAYLAESPSTAFVVGKDGWLFYANDHSIEDCRHTAPLTEAQLEGWRRTYTARRDWLAQYGIQYVAFMGPNKHSIYPEMLPSTLKQVHPTSRYDQLVAYLGKYPGSPFVDVRAPLLQAKPIGRLYKKGDTHWNEQGAFVAYQEVMGELAKHLPGLKPIARSEFEVENFIERNADLARNLGLGKLLPEQDVRMIPRKPRAAVRSKEEVYPGLALPAYIQPFAMESPSRSLRAVVFRDSFFTLLAPFVAEHFGRSVFVWHQPFDPELILKEKPDVVIDEIVERALWYDPPPPLVPVTDIPRQPSSAVSANVRNP
jgi:alginate O-acetyltransferase complex protein AlgJ